jgi:hypothetical protein
VIYLEPAIRQDTSTRTAAVADAAS